MVMITYNGNGIDRQLIWEVIFHVAGGPLPNRTFALLHKIEIQNNASSLFMTYKSLQNSTLEAKYEI